MKKPPLLLLTTFLCVSFYASAAGMGDVRINEIAWMGTTTSFNDEWIELFNATESTVHLDGWRLTTADGKLKISLRGDLFARGFYLLERTDDTSVAATKADILYKGSLSNSGQDLQLYDTMGNLVDGANFSSGWAFGNNITKQTMERATSGEWQTSKDIHGTPKAENSAGFIVKTNDSVLKTQELTYNTADVAQTSLEGSLNNPQTKQTHSPLFLFLATLAVIIFLSIIILVIKFHPVKYFFINRSDRQTP